MNYEYFQRAFDISRACTPGCTDPIMFNYDPASNLVSHGLQLRSLWVIPILRL